MKKTIATFIALLSLTSFAFASDGTPPAGLTSIILQNGVYPDVNYAGIKATYITTGVAFADSGKNYGGSQDVKMAASAATAGQAKALYQVDLAPIPDNAVIYRARFYKYQTGPASNAPTESVIRAHRIGLEWGEGSADGANEEYAADWNKRTDTPWSTPGMASYVTNGTSGTPFGKRWAPFSGIGSDSATFATFSGTDTISVLAAGIDYAQEPTATSFWKQGNTAQRQFGWVVEDITNMVRQWHSGAVPNNGWMEEIDSAPTVVATFSYASDEYAYVHRRPKIVIEYIDLTPLVEETTSGTGRRTIGGGGITRGVY